MPLVARRRAKSSDSIVEHDVIVCRWTAHGMGASLVLSESSSDGPAESDRDGVANLHVLRVDRANESPVVREALKRRTLANRHRSEGFGVT